MIAKDASRICRVRGRVRFVLNGRTYLIELRESAITLRRLHHRNRTVLSLGEFIDLVTGQGHLPLFNEKE